MSDLLRGKKWLLFIIVIFLMAAVNIGISLASHEPDVTAIVTNGEVAVEGDLLGNVKYGWYPGQVKEGILRIRNDGPGSFRINTIDVEVVLKNAYGSLIDQGKYDYKIYAVTIKDGDVVLFPRENNVSVPAINLNKDGFIDLDYRVEMDQRSSNELQGSEARITIAVNLTEPSSASNTPSEIGDQLAEITHGVSDYVTELSKRGIISPRSDGSFGLDEYITRAETAVLIGKALVLAEKPNEPTVYLDDKELPEEARGYIAACYQAGIMVGYELYPGREFRPACYMPREELYCVFMRAFNKKLLGDVTLPFTDKHMISDWAVTDIKAAVQNGIPAEYPDNTFQPKQPMTRAEAYTIVCELMGYHL